MRRNRERQGTRGTAIAKGKDEKPRIEEKREQFARPTSIRTRSRTTGIGWSKGIDQRDEERERYEATR